MTTTTAHFTRRDWHFTSAEAKAIPFRTGASARRAQAAFYKREGVMLSIIMADTTIHGASYHLMHPWTEMLVSKVGWC